MDRFTSNHDQNDQPAHCTHYRRIHFTSGNASFQSKLDCCNSLYQAIGLLSEISNKSTLTDSEPSYTCRCQNSESL